MASAASIPPGVSSWPGYPPRSVDVAEASRDIVHDAVPEAIERVRTGWRLIGYDIPLDRRTRYFTFVAPEREHVHLGSEPIGSAIRTAILGAGRPPRLKKVRPLISSRRHDPERGVYAVADRVRPGHDPSVPERPTQGEVRGASTTSPAQVLLPRYSAFRFPAPAVNHAGAAMRGFTSAIRALSCRGAHRRDKLVAAWSSRRRCSSRIPRAATCTAIQR